MSYKDGLEEPAIPKVSSPAGKGTAEGAAAPGALVHGSRDGSRDGSTQTDGAAESSGHGDGTERPPALPGESPRRHRGCSRLCTSIADFFILVFFFKAF